MKHKDEINLYIGKHIRSLRKEHGYNQEQLASILNLTRTSICNIECGRQCPTMHTLLMICGLFKCSLNDITPKVPSVSIKRHPPKKVKKVITLRHADISAMFMWK